MVSRAFVILPTLADITRIVSVASTLSDVGGTVIVFGIGFDFELLCSGDSICGSLDDICSVLLASGVDSGLGVGNWLPPSVLGCWVVGPAALFISFFVITMLVEMIQVRTQPDKMV